METPPESESLQTSFRTYVEELREFFMTSRIDCGSPAALSPFMRRLEASNSLQNDLSSLMRSILYRERENISREQLVFILVQAVAGRSQATLPPEINEQLRQLEVLVNGVMRSRQSMIPSEITASDEEEESAEPVYRATRTLDQRMENADPFPAESTVSVSRRKGYRQSSAFAPEEPFDTTPPERRAVPPQAVVDVSLQEPRRSRFAWNMVRFQWTSVVAVAMVFLVGMAVYLSPVIPRRSPRRESTEPGPASVGGEASSSYPVRCVGVPHSPASRLVLDRQYNLARDLVEQNSLPAALPILEEVAAADPGLPGINLLISQVLWRLNRPRDARRAVDTQMGISDCLTTVSDEELKAYCALELAPQDRQRCSAHVASDRETTHLLIALFDTEVTPESGKPDSDARGPQSAARTPAKPASTSRGITSRKEAGGRAAQRPLRTSPDRAQAEGEGTDSDLGAYSRPPQ